MMNDTRKIGNAKRNERQSFVIIIRVEIQFV